MTVRILDSIIITLGEVERAGGVSCLLCGEIED